MMSSMAVLLSCECIQNMPNNEKNGVSEQYIINESELLL